MKLITPQSDSSAKKSATKKDISYIPAPELASFPHQIQSFFAGESLTAPLPIQKLVWPHLLAGKDVEAVAEPGSGKTIAYLLPAAVALAEQGHSGKTRPDAPLSLVLLPTRELAQQVAGVCKAVRKYCGGLRFACLVGGIEKEGQVVELKKQPHILIATPGRLLDMIDDGRVSLGKLI